MTTNLAKWASKYAQITKIWLSDGCGGETIPMTVRIAYDRRGFDNYLGIIGLRCWT